MITRNSLKKLKMALQVRITRRAGERIEKLLEYLETNWSSKASADFLESFERAILLIQSHPASFPKSSVIKGLHKCVVSKQSTIYYTFDKDFVYIITLFDSRQNPQKLKREVRF